ncbi:MAG: restriction endonuclease subunit S [Gammaproteobacteria bacterium]|nr:restriction endonuclease subunit S [Gammaproteobacteria bacterium]
MNKTSVSESPLGSLVTIKQGYTFSRSYQGNAEGKWMYVKVADLNSLGNKKYVYRTKNYVDDDVLEKIKATPFPANSIVFPRVGAALKLNNKLLLTEDCVTDDNVIVITVTDEEKCYFEYLYYWFEFQDLGRFCNSGAVPVISGKNLKKELVPLPPLDEQKKISRVLSEWDNAIEKTEALITAKEKQFEWLTSNLINRAGHKRTAASGLMTEVSRRNKSSTIERVLSVTNHSGFVLPEEQFERRVASANVSNYKVVEQGQYAYNPSRINVGSIARLDDWENGILSPMYVVFKLDTKKVCSDYFLHWVNSSEARQRIKNSAQGSVRETVSFKDLGAIDIPLPAMDVQKDVTYKLNLAQKEISLLKNTLEQYRSQKRGLMQKLLTGEWQVGSSQHLSEETYQEASA